MLKAVLLLGGTLALTTGCGGSDSDSAQPSSVGAVDVERSELPSDSFTARSTRFTILTQDLVNRGAVDCMANAGFDYRWQSPPIPEVEVDQRRYGLSEMPEDGRPRYAPEEPVFSATSPPLPPSDGEREGFHQALEGDPSEALTRELQTPFGTLGIVAPAGCIGQSIESLFGSRDEYVEVQTSFSLVEDWSNESLSWLYAHPDYQSAVNSWAACMSEAGLGNFDSPYEPASLDFADDDEEVRTARIDLRCKDESHLVSIASSIEFDWQQDTLGEIAGHLERLSDAEQLLLENAALTDE